MEIIVIMIGCLVLGWVFGIVFVAWKSTKIISDTVSVGCAEDLGDKFLKCAECGSSDILKVPYTYFSSNLHNRVVLDYNLKCQKCNTLYNRDWWR